MFQGRGGLVGAGLVGEGGRCGQVFRSGRGGRGMSGRGVGQVGAGLQVWSGSLWDSFRTPPDQGRMGILTTSCSAKDPVICLGL